MNDLLLSKGIILQSGEISKDKVNLAEPITARQFNLKSFVYLLLRILRHPDSVHAVRLCHFDVDTAV